MKLVSPTSLLTPCWAASWPGFFCWRWDTRSGFTGTSSRHKQLRIADGAWGAGVLSAEDEKAWKRSELWHDVVLGTLVLAGILYLIFSKL